MINFAHNAYFCFKCHSQYIKRLLSGSARKSRRMLLQIFVVLAILIIVCAGSLSVNVNHFDLN
jgi:hypothetical protein